MSNRFSQPGEGYRPVVKLLLLLVVVVVICVVLFLTGLFSPKRSRRMQQSVKRQNAQARRKSSDSAGKVGDWTRDSLEHAENAVDKSAEAGRAVHEAARESTRGKS